MGKSQQVDKWIAIGQHRGYGISLFHVKVESEKQFLCDKAVHQYADGSLHVYSVGRNRRFSREEVVLDNIPFEAIQQILEAEREYHRWEFPRFDQLREELRPIEEEYRRKRGAVESAYQREQYENWQEAMHKFEGAIQAARAKENDAQ